MPRRLLRWAPIARPALQALAIFGVEIAFFKAPAGDFGVLLRLPFPGRSPSHSRRMPAKTNGRSSVRHVHFGSLAEVAARRGCVRFALANGHPSAPLLT